MNGLAQGTANVMIDWNRKTSSVIVYMCVFRVREVIPFSLEKNDHIYLNAIIARSARAGFVITTVIASAG